MFSSLPVLFASALALSGGDTVKKKIPLVPVPAKSAKSASPSASALIARAASETMARFAGPSAGKTISAAAHAVTPRATYLRSAVASRMPAARAAGGPPLPARFRTEANAVSIVADSIVVEKARRTMTLYNQGTPVRIYFVALGANPVGAKVSLGDRRTPEGIYHIAGHNPNSKYHLSLLVSYPNEKDLAQARANGVTTGGDIMIHGLPDRFADYGAAHRQWNWTKGCIAVTNAEIEEIWAATPDGATIQIKP
jgi:lipoprotein-anchoring transpeptidase ErfK/SrfK